MNFNFELILFYAVLVTGVISLIDIIWFAKKRQTKMPLIIEYARSFFPILLLVFLLRSFLFEPFRIPSGSLEPTLAIGDFVVVNKFAYGIRLPVTHQKLFQMSEPKRGDIFVFRYPAKPKYDFIKRVIGLPGDHIRYTDKVLYINNQKIQQADAKDATRIDEEGNLQKVDLKQEDLLGVKHAIYQNPNVPVENFNDIVVPQGMYFAMGDNRDDSADSRFWGFVPEKNLVGRAVLIWMSWDAEKHRIRWNRLGTIIH